MNLETLIIIVALTGVFSFAQEPVFSQDFETLVEAKALNLKKWSLQFWVKPNGK